MCRARRPARGPFLSRHALNREAVYLDGKVDLASAGPEGWVLVDYKTNRATVADVETLELPRQARPRAWRVDQPGLPVREVIFLFLDPAVERTLTIDGPRRGGHAAVGGSADLTGRRPGGLTSAATRFQRLSSSLRLDATVQFSRNRPRGERAAGVGAVPGHLVTPADTRPSSR